MVTYSSTSTTFTNLQFKQKKWHMAGINFEFDNDIHPLTKYVNSSHYPFAVHVHTSKINVLRSSLNSKETLQNFLYSYKKKTQVVFFVFQFEQLSFSPYECPGLCRHRPGHSYGEK